MNSPAPQTSGNNGATSARDLFAFTDEQILQIEPDAQDAEMFARERTDTHDPLREDLDLLAASAPANGADDLGLHRRNGARANDGLEAVATKANAAAEVGGQTTRTTETSTGASTVKTVTVSDEAPAWLAERMNDPQNGADARALWDGVLAARQEASAFREVFAKPEDARAAGERARILDDFDHAYFGPAGGAPEQLSASRSKLASKMFREDPVAFREMVFAGLRVLESAAQQGSSAEVVAPPFSLPRGTKGAASSDAPATQGQTLNTQTFAPQQSFVAQQTAASQQHDTRVAAYAVFERATNAELERGVGSVIDRSLQAALPNAARSENGAALKERLGAAIRQDVEKALQGDRALGEQVARVLSGQRLDDATRAQVVRLISDRAQQLVPGSARRVLADWTQTTLASHGSRADHGSARQSAGGANVDAGITGIGTSATTQKKTSQVTQRAAPAQRNTRKIDYRRVSDDDILAS